MANNGSPFARGLRVAALILLALLTMTACRKIAPSSPEENSEVNSNIGAANSPVAQPSPTARNYETDPKLQSEADELLPLFAPFEPVPVRLRDEPIVKKGTETQKGVGYTICSHKAPTIFIKKVFYQKANRKQLVNILKHEMTHAWFCRQGIQTGHDDRFRQKFREVGGFGN